MITVRANARNVTYISDDLITSGSVGIPATFVLSDDFDGLACIAVFRGSGTARDVALIGSTCVVPHEVLAQAGGYLYIGIYAANGEGTIVIPTVWSGGKMILQGTEPSEVDPPAPTPSWAAQVQAAAAEALANSEEAIEIAGGAEAAAEEARQSASAAAAAATAAGQSASAADAAQTAAEEAQTAAASARDAAVAAQGSAENSAQAAAGSAAEAVGSAEAAAASEAAAREVQESIPADYTALSEDVGELKSQIDDLPSIADSDAEDVDLDLTDDDGNVILRLEGGNIQTKNFSSRYTNADVEESNASGVDLDITDSFGNVVARLKDGHIKTSKFDSSDFVGMPDDVDDLQTDVAALQSATSGIVYRNHDMNDGVFAACRWHQPYGADHQFCLLLGGDVHADQVRMNSMIEYLNTIDCFDAGIMLGDITAWDKDATWYTEAISNSTKPFLTIVGNHDVSNTTGGQGYEYIHDMYEKFYAPNLQYADLASGEHVSEDTYYFKDFDSQKIRMIMLNDYEYPADKTDGSLVYTRGDRCYSQDQIDWLIDTLGDTPSDYGVIIAAHFWPGSMTIDSANILTSSMSVNTFTPHSLIAQTNGFIIEDIVNAWINGTTLSKTYDYTVSGTFGTGIDAEADFSQRGAGEFITYINGHWHMSIVAKTYNYSQGSYTVAATGLYAETQSDQPRKEGTRSEDHLAALAVDRDRKTVKVIQIGAHFSMDAADRLYGKYQYATVD